MGHPASDIFKREMALVDSDKLLKNEQGLASRDYDLHHYDYAGGWLTKEDDPEKNSKTSYVVVHHFFARPGKRQAIILWLNAFAEEAKGIKGVQSSAVLQEINDTSLVTLWLRYDNSLASYHTREICFADSCGRTNSVEDFENFKSSELYSGVIGKKLAPGGVLVSKIELHNSRTFIGHIDKK